MSEWELLELRRTLELARRRARQREEERDAALAEVARLREEAEQERSWRQAADRFATEQQRRAIAAEAEVTRLKGELDNHQRKTLDLAERSRDEVTRLKMALRDAGSALAAIGSAGHMTQAQRILRRDAMAAIDAVLAPAQEKKS